jgi:hypothetical protein
VSLRRPENVPADTTVFVSQGCLVVTNLRILEWVRTSRATRQDEHRPDAAKKQFERDTGYPHGRAGNVVDHKVPLACTGADDQRNMQWQTVADAKAKDKW